MGDNGSEEDLRLDLQKTGALLKQLRNEKGLTQEQLADHFHVTNRTVSRWETGSNMPDISLLVEIADFYGVDVREIIDGERKNSMNEEIKEVATKMADYAGNEKNKQMGSVRTVGIVGLVLLALSIGFQFLTYKSGLNPLLSIAFTFLALIAMAVVVLYSNGIIKRLMKKKGIGLAIQIVTIFIIVYAASVAFTTALVLAVGFAGYMQPYNNVSGIGSYNKAEIVEKFRADLDSSLFLFPDDSDKALSAEFVSATRTGLFDTDGYFILTAYYDEEQMASEIERLSNVTCTVSDHHGNSVTNQVVYDADMYNYPAYIASDGYDYMYEYALIDEADSRIIYVLLSFPEIDRLDAYRDYLKKDLSGYEYGDDVNVLENFCIYSHSFNGEVWMEYGDAA